MVARIIFLYFCMSFNDLSMTYASSLDQNDEKIFGGRKLNLIKSFSFESNNLTLGQTILLSEAPYQVSIRILNEHRCGGALISERFVLSAAHCAVLNKVSDFIVRVGSKYRESGGELFRVRSVHIHPQHNPETGNNDFSVFELSKNIKLLPGVKEIIKMANSNEVIDAGTLTLVSGWGTTDKSEVLSNELMGVVIPIVDQKRCKKVYRGLTDQMICAGYSEGGKDSCEGKKILFIFATEIVKKLNF